MKHRRRPIRPLVKCPGCLQNSLNGIASLLPRNNEIICYFHGTFKVTKEMRAIARKEDTRIKQLIKSIRAP